MPHRRNDTYQIHLIKLDFVQDGRHENMRASLKNYRPILTAIPEKEEPMPEYAEDAEDAELKEENDLNLDYYVQDEKFQQPIQAAVVEIKDESAGRLDYLVTLPVVEKSEIKEQKTNELQLNGDNIDKEQNGDEDELGACCLGYFDAVPVGDGNEDAPPEELSQTINNNNDEDEGEDDDELEMII